KAKEETEFWENARALLADPRFKALSAPEPRPVTAPPACVPGAYGEVRNNVYAVLPDADANIGNRLTTQQIVSLLQQGGYTFKAKEPPIAVNGALMALEEKGLAE